MKLKSTLSAFPVAAIKNSAVKVIKITGTLQLLQDYPYTINQVKLFTEPVAFLPPYSIITLKASAAAADISTNAGATVTGNTCGSF